MNIIWTALTDGTITTSLVVNAITTSLVVITWILLYRRIRQVREEVEVLGLVVDRNTALSNRRFETLHETNHRIVDVLERNGLLKNLDPVQEDVNATK